MGSHARSSARCTLTFVAEVVSGEPPLLQETNGELPEEAFYLRKMDGGRVHILVLPARMRIEQHVAGCQFVYLRVER